MKPSLKDADEYSHADYELGAVKLNNVPVEMDTAQVNAKDHQHYGRSKKAQAGKPKVSYSGAPVGKTRSQARRT